MACEESQTSHKALEEQSQAQVLPLTFLTACSLQQKKRCSVTEAAMAYKIECNRQATALEDKLREVEEAFHEI